MDQGRATAMSSDTEAKFVALVPTPGEQLIIPQPEQPRISTSGIQDIQPPPAQHNSTSCRPARAVNRKQRTAAIMACDPVSWTVRDVCDWLEDAGLGRHRKIFVHHAVSGALLPKLNAEVLKVDLGIVSLGQREALISAIQDVLQKSRSTNLTNDLVLVSAADISSSESPATMTANRSGAMQERCARLRRQLEKAEARAVQLKAAADQAQRVSELAQREVFNLHEKLVKVEGRAFGRRTHPAPPPAVVRGHDIGRDDSASREKKQAANAAFMQRLRKDLEARKAKRRRDIAAAAGPSAARRGRTGSRGEKGGETLVSSLEIIRSHVGDDDPALKLSLNPDEPEDRLVVAIHDASTVMAGAVGISDEDVAAVKATVVVEKKAARLAAAIRTALFMQRLQQDLATRDDRKKEMRLRWLTDRAERVARNETRDLADARTRFHALGWPESSGDVAWDELLAALVNRGKVAGKAKADAKPIDWELCKHDGLLAYDLSLDSTTASATKTGLGTALLPATTVEGDNVTPSSASAPAGTQTRSSNQAAGSPLLLTTVELLSSCRIEELDRLLGFTGTKRVLAVHRALKTQQFLKETRADLHARAAKLAEVHASETPVRGKKLKKEAQTAFLERLAEDAARRSRNKEELQAKAREAEKLLRLAPKKNPTLSKD